jgi:tight adherence protein C
MISSPLFVAISAFMFFAAAGVTLYLGIYADRTMLEDRLNDLAVKVRATDGFAEDDDTAQSPGLAGMLLRWATRRLPVPKVDNPRAEKLIATLAHAGYNRQGAVRMFQLVRIGTALVGGLIAAVICIIGRLPLRMALVYAVCGAAMFHLLPLFYLGWRAKGRQAKIRKELSDVLDLLVVCVEAGLGIYEAIKVVGREAERQGREMGTELSILSGELTAGSTLGVGMRAMAERTGVDDVRGLAAILIQSERLGSQMAPALRATSDQQRAKRRLRAEEAAQKSTIKMLIPLAVFVLPAMMAVILGPAAVQIYNNFKH